MHGERTIVSFAVQSKQTLYDTHHTTDHTKRAKTQIGTRILHSSPQVVGLLFFDQMGFTSEGRQFSWLFLSGHGASVAHYAPAEGCGYVPAREQTNQSATGHLQAAQYDHTNHVQMSYYFLFVIISKLHGMIIRPGETFSVWRHVGRPTARKGYLEGLVLSQGKIGKGVGGGLCQLGNLLFWMFAHTPLSIVERHRHSFDVFPDINRSIPFGAGATLSYNYIDLRVRNNTPHTYRLELWLDDTHLNGRISSDTEQRDRYRIEETGHRIEHQSWGGYTRHNKLVRIVTRADGSEYPEPFVANHASMMYNPLLSPPQNGASTSYQR